MSHILDTEVRSENLPWDVVIEKRCSDLSCVFYRVDDLPKEGGQGNSWSFLQSSGRGTLQLVIKAI